jgi:Kef-type K+ transport system membrane component KefB
MIDARVYFDFPAMAALVTCLSVSSVVASMKVLIRTGKLNTGFGRVMLSTGVMDALFGLAVFTLLSVFLPAGMAGGVNVLAKIISIALMLVVLFVLGENIVPKVMQYAEALKVEEAQFTLAFVVMLVLATVVRVFGLHGIIGAFIAGIIVSRSAARDGGFSEKLASLSYGVFVPIFFAWVGMLAFSQYQLPFWSVFIPVLAVGVFLANFIGRAVGALIGGFDARQAMLVGLGMVPRGGVGLVILAAMATTTGVTGFVYSTILLVVLASVLVSPLFMLASMKEKAI